MRRAPTSSIWNACEGGVGIFTKEASTSAYGDPHSHEAQVGGAQIAEMRELYESGRWTAASIPLGSGNRNAYVHSFYSPSCPDQDPFKRSLTDRLTKILFGVAATSGPTPTIIAADFNRDPEQSEIIRAAIASGRWIDIAKIYAGSERPPPTYRREGPFPGMDYSDQASRLDAILCNTSAWAAVKDFSYQFELGVPSHVGLKVVFKIPAFGAKALYQKVPKELIIPGEIPEEELQELWEKFADKARINQVRNSTAVGETSKAFETLSDVGVDFIKTVILCNDGGGDNDRDIEHLESPEHMRRGRVAAFEAREVSAKSVDGNKGVRR